MKSEASIETYFFIHLNLEKVNLNIWITCWSLEDKLSKLTDKIEKLSVKIGSESINSGSVTNAAIGTASANALTYGVQKMFAPQTLPATKKDLDELRNEMKKIIHLLSNINLRKLMPDISVFW